VVHTKLPKLPETCRTSEISESLWKSQEVIESLRTTSWKVSENAKAFLKSSKYPNFESVWKSLEVSESVRKSLKVSERVWKFPKMQAHLWNLRNVRITEISESIWKSLKISQSLGTYLKVFYNWKTSLKFPTRSNLLTFRGLRKSPKVSESLRKIPNVSDETFGNFCRFSPIWRFQRFLRRFLEVSEISETFGDVWRRSETFGDIFWWRLATFSETFGDFLETFGDVWRRSVTFEDVRRRLETFFGDVWRFWQMRTFRKLRRSKWRCSDIFGDFRKFQRASMYHNLFTYCLTSLFFFCYFFIFF